MPKILDLSKLELFAKKGGLVFGASLFFLFASFAGMYLPLWEAWQKDEYSHGPLIPLLAFLIGWHRLVEKKPAIKADGTGLVFVVAGLVLFEVCQLSAFEVLARYGFIVALLGIFWTCCGRAFVKVLSPSFVYLLFAVPLPSYIYVTLSAEMQLASSGLGVSLLRLLGIVVYQEGNVIDLGSYKLQVVEACSGLRYLFPLLSFSFLIAFLFDDKAWKRWTVFLSAIPLTIVMNAVRIAVIGITVNQWGIAMAEGVLHDFEGWAVFGVCVLLLFLETRLLSLVGKGKQGSFRYDTIALPRDMISFAGLSCGWRELTVLFLTATFAFFVVTGVAARKEEVVPARSSFASFPLETGDWRGAQKNLTTGELSLLQLTDYLLADYTQTKEKYAVNLYMAYYASQRVGSAIHSPGNCLPGSGWEIAAREVVPLSLDGFTLPVTRAVIRKGEEALLVYYWFQGRGRISNEQYEAKWYLLVDSITKHRTDGALVRLTIPVSRGQSVEEADRRLQSFLSQIYPRLETFIPSDKNAR